MSSVVVPTITATDQTDYKRQVEQVKAFATRLHIDFIDGILAPTRSPRIADAWWPEGVMVDLHVMYKNPSEQLEAIVSMQPHLVIIHAEADGITEFLDETKGLGIKRGLALLKDTPVDKITKYLNDVDHVLIFSGTLGKFGGTVDLNLLHKVKVLKAHKPSLEIGWDGGINAENIAALSQGGVDVLNVGGFIHNAGDPEAAYDKLVEVIG